MAAVKESSLDKARDAIKKFGKKSQGKLTTILSTMKNWAKSFSTTPPTEAAIRWVINASLKRLQIKRGIALGQPDGSQSRPDHSGLSRTKVTVGSKKRDGQSITCRAQQQWGEI